MLDRLGARTSVMDGEPIIPSVRAAPPTRLDPSEVESDASVQERPAGGLALADSTDRALAEGPNVPSVAGVSGNAVIAAPDAAASSGQVEAVADALVPRAGAQGVP